jgi:hypothetical protein
MELIENLSKSLKKEKKSKDNSFYKSFAAFGSEKPANEIIAEIKASRKLWQKKTCCQPSLILHKCGFCLSLSSQFSAIKN